MLCWNVLKMFALKFFAINHKIKLTSFWITNPLMLLLCIHGQYVYEVCFVCLSLLHLCRWITHLWYKLGYLGKQCRQVKVKESTFITQIEAC
jgi:hypothetical protein